MKASIVYERIFFYDVEIAVKNGETVKIIDRKNEKIMTLNDLPYETVVEILAEIGKEYREKPIDAISNRYEFYSQIVVEYEEGKHNVLP